MQPFYVRLKDYYSKVGQVLRGESAASSIFPNTTDIGIARERLYKEFLKLHLPSACNVMLGGFLFNMAGEESKQLDVIVTANTCPQFIFHNADGSGKSFACIEGTIAVASIKTTLDSRNLIETLENIASLPDKEPLGNKAMPMAQIKFYEDWPFKIVFATDGVSKETFAATLDAFYKQHADIPNHKRPNLIHVAGKYNAVRTREPSKTRDGTPVPANSFWIQPDASDAFALAYAVQQIQLICMACNVILFQYDSLLDRIPM